MLTAFEQQRQRGWSYLNRGCFTEAAASFDAAEALGSTGAEVALARIHLASVSVLQGVASRYTEALPLLLMRHDSPLHVYLAAYYLTIHFLERRRMERAAHYLKLARDAADELANPYYRASAYDLSSELTFSNGDTCAAYEYATLARDLLDDCAPSDEIIMARAVVAHNRGYALLAQSRYDEAIAPLEYGAAVFDERGVGVHAVLAHMNLAFASFAVDDTSESEGHLHAAETRIDDATEWLRKYVYYLRGEIAQRRGRHEEARAEYRHLSLYYPGFANLVELLSGVSLFPLLLPERT